MCHCQVSRQHVPDSGVEYVCEGRKSPLWEDREVRLPGGWRGSRKAGMSAEFSFGPCLVGGQLGAVKVPEEGVQDVCAFMQQTFTDCHINTGQSHNVDIL